MAMLTAACGGTPAAGFSSGASIALPEITASPHENTPSALRDPSRPGLPRPLVDPAEVLPGGPPPDGIPPIDHPRFERANAVHWIHDREPVISLTVGTDSRAYPIQVLIWHEIVNDTVGGEAVAVTYCPLCNSAIAFKRRDGERMLDFGTSGMLYRSDLVMYDRQTESLWSQFIGTAIEGVLTGHQLSSIPVQLVGWADWRTAHSNGWVLSRDTGFARDYGSNPYPGYDSVDTPPFAFRGAIDGRYPPKTRLVGIRRGGDSVAVMLDALRHAHVIDTSVGDEPVVVWEVDGTASPLDQGLIAEGQEVGSTAAFDPLLDGRHLHFVRSSDGFTDVETGSTWDLLGQASGGPLAGQALTPVAHDDTFWFAWAAFLPATRVVR